MINVTGYMAKFRYSHVMVNSPTCFAFFLHRPICFTTRKIWPLFACKANYLERTNWNFFVGLLWYFFVHGVVVDMSNMQIHKEHEAIFNRPTQIKPKLGSIWSIYGRPRTQHRYIFDIYLFGSKVLQLDNLFYFVSL
jgi:hypothetical protein